MLKNSHTTTKKIKSFAIFGLYLLSFSSFSQSTEKQIIRVEKMEYIYTCPESSDLFNSFLNYRVVMPSDPEIADKMKQSVLTAINHRWNATVLNPHWNLKATGRYNSTKKFKTNFKKETPNNWHLFLQIIDNGSYSFTENQTFQNSNYTPFYYQFNVQIIDGNDKSIIFSNKMTVEMQRRSAPDGQLLLQTLPFLADSFVQAFDTAVQTLFAPTPQSELKLEVAPACLFLDINKTLENTKKLNFVSKNDSLIELLQLKQEWIVQNSSTQKKKKINHLGENVSSYALTLLTGIGTDKIKEIEYATKFGFVDTSDNTHYFCEIPFIEGAYGSNEREVTKEANGQKSYELVDGNSRVSRSFKPDQICYLIREKDTIGNFKFITGERAGSKNSIPQYWDGKNDSTISDIPEYWKNSESYLSSNQYFLDGELNKVHFIIENSKAGKQTDIEINDQEIMKLKIVNDKPVFGLLYPNTADEKTLSILMMLSSMPLKELF
jgi:hypothetical protein